MPKFKISFKANMVNILMNVFQYYRDENYELFICFLQMGIVNLFDVATVNLSGISGQLVEIRKIWILFWVGPWNRPDWNHGVFCVSYLSFEWLILCSPRFLFERSIIHNYQQCITRRIDIFTPFYILSGWSRKWFHPLVLWSCHWSAFCVLIWTLYAQSQSWKARIFGENFIYSIILKK